MGVWSGDKIYCLSPLLKLGINNNLIVTEDVLIQDSLLQPILGYGPRYLRYLSINSGGNRLLLVMSLYSDVSVGDLIAIDLISRTFLVLRDSAYNISSALYWRSDSQCIYYSYGNPQRGTIAGYYYLNILANRDSLILAHASDLGPAEVTNGFDISPDQMQLVVPLNYSTRTPRILVFDLFGRTADTLNINFKHQLLWLRYNPTGTQFLYSNYPRGSGGSTVTEDGEIGIIERATLATRVLDANTTPGGLSVNVFPNWSPDGKHVVYGSAPGPLSEPPGAIGAFSLYILKAVN